MTAIKEKISILGCGWLGWPLAVSLIKNGYSVKGSTTTKEKVSLLEKDGIEGYWLKSDRHISGKNLSAFFQSNVLFLDIPFKRNFENPWDYKQQIDAIVEFVKPSGLGQVIFASSTSVYPDQLAVASEDVYFSPTNERSKVLLEIEKDLMANKNFKTTIIRFAGLFGGDRKIGKFLSAQKDIADKDAPVNLIHQEDCVEIIKMIIKKKVYGEIINAVCDEHPTKENLYTKAALKLGLPPPQFSNAVTTAKRIVSNKKLKALLKYTFKYPNPLDCIEC